MGCRGQVLTKARAAVWRHTAVQRCAGWAFRDGAASDSGERGHELQGHGDGGEGMLGAQTVFLFLAGGCSTDAGCHFAGEGWFIVCTGQWTGIALNDPSTRSRAGASF